MTSQASDDPDKVFSLLALPGFLQHSVIKALIDEKESPVERFKSRERDSLLSLKQWSDFNELQPLIETSPGTFSTVLVETWGSSASLVLNAVDRVPRERLLWMFSKRPQLVSGLGAGTGLALSMNANQLKKMLPVLKVFKGASIDITIKMQRSGLELASTLPSLSLQELELTGMFESSGQALCKALGACSSLKALALNVIWRDGPRDLSHLALPPGLQKLELSVRGEESRAAVARLLSDRCPASLTELAFRNLDASSFGCLPPSAPFYSGLKRLDLYKVDTVSNREASILKQLKSLEVLVLSSSSCRPEDKLWSHLKPLPSLVILDIGGCSLGFSEGQAGEKEMGEFASIASFPNLRFIGYCSDDDFEFLLNLLSTLSSSGRPSTRDALESMKARGSDCWRPWKSSRV